MADESSVHIFWNWMNSNRSDCRRGAGSPKNESGRAALHSLPDRSSRSVSDGNCFCVAVTDLGNGEVGFLPLKMSALSAVAALRDVAQKTYVDLVWSIASKSYRVHAGLETSFRKGNPRLSYSTNGGWSEGSSRRAEERPHYGYNFVPEYVRLCHFGCCSVDFLDAGVR